MIEFVVYSRHGCHLCEDLLQQLMQLQQVYDFSVTEVDVDESEQLITQYGSKVPVVICKNEEVCHYFLDQQSVVKLLED